MVFLRYILIIFFVYLFLSLTILRFSVVYIENNKQLLESYLSYINYNYIIKRPGLKNNTNPEIRSIKVVNVEGNWRGIYPSLSLEIENLNKDKNSNIRFPNKIDLKINIYKTALFFKPVLKSIYIENVFYKNSIEKLIKNLKDSKKLKNINIDDIQIANSEFEIEYKKKIFAFKEANLSIKENSIKVNTLIDENKRLRVNLSNIYYRDGEIKNLKYSLKLDGNFNYDFKKIYKTNNISLRGNDLSLLFSGNYANSRFQNNKVSFKTKQESKIIFSDHHFYDLNANFIFNLENEKFFEIEFDNIKFLSKAKSPYVFDNAAIRYNFKKKDLSLFFKDIEISSKNLIQDFNSVLYLKDTSFLTYAKDLYINLKLDDIKNSYFFSGNFLNSEFSYKSNYIKNFSGFISSSKNASFINLNSENITLSYQSALRKNLKFEKASGQLKIINYLDPIVLFSNFKLSNSDIKIKSTGYINSLDNKINFGSYVDYIDMKKITNYFPLSFMSKKTSDYFKKSFTKGFTRSGNIYINGNLSNYPFYPENNGISYAALDIKKLNVDYRKGWVPFNNINGKAYFQKNKAFFIAENFKVLDTELSGGNLYIDDVNNTELWMSGDLKGPFSDLLRFSNKAKLTSVSNNKIKSLEGASKTNFRMKISFIGNKNYYESSMYLDKIIYTFDKNNSLKNISGTIKYKDDNFYTEKDKPLSADFDKNKIKFSLRNDEKGNFIVYGKHKISLEDYISDKNILDNIHGESLWNIKFIIPGLNSKKSLIRVEAISDMNGIKISYPEPFYKNISESSNAEINFDIKNFKFLNIKVSYKDIYSEFSSLDKLNGYIDFSGKKNVIPKNKINLIGTINEVNLDEWKKITKEGSQVDYLSYINKLDLNFNKFISDKLIIDKLSIKGYTTLNQFNFNNISASNQFLKLNATGTVEYDNISSFKFRVESENLENLLNYWSFNHGIRDAYMDSNFDISWKGGLFDFGLENIYGKLTTTMKNGRLKKVGNRATRIFGLFNIDLLAKRLSLDFDDVTKNGFYFSSFNGDFRIEDGNIFTTNLLIKGPSAELLTVGTTNFIEETYDMQVIASPEFGETLPAIALLGGPITAAATFAAEKLAKAFGRDINDLIKIKYKVTGTWDDPKIKIINKKSDALDDVEELFE